MLYEYPFSLEITASLESISWLLQQFSSDDRSPGNKDSDLNEWLGMIQRGVIEARFPVTQPDTVRSIGPLIVRGFHIEGSAIEANRISHLQVKIDLAGMNFIPDVERGAFSGGRGDKRQAGRTNGTGRTESNGVTKPRARN